MSQRGASRPPLVRLDDESIDRLASAIAGRLGQRAIAGAWMTAEDVAVEHRVSVSWVYAHKRDLAGEPLGTGPKPRWRFLRARVEAYFHAGHAAAAVDPTPAPAAQARPSQDPRPAADRRVELLPIRGRCA